MLYPQNNRCRAVIDLCGFWELKVDAQAIGREKDWHSGFEPDAIVGVPGSWNEQLAELGLMNYVGLVWYQKQFCVPQTLQEKTLYLHFGSVDFHACVWLNGHLLGEHRSGFLPFEFDISPYCNEGDNRLVVAVDNVLSHDTIPQSASAEDFRAFSKEREESFPPTVFDFFPYGGIHRSVNLIALSKQHITSIEVGTGLDDATGSVSVRAEYSQEDERNCGARLTLSLDGETVREWSGSANQVMQGVTLEVNDCRPWSPQDPCLYRLSVQLFDGDLLLDEYEQDVGIRQISVEGHHLLLNGEPIFLKGFGKHEDFAILGKGFSAALAAKDFHLMNWIGANSFRAAHYPYAEEVLQLADQMGFLVIAECSAVSLNLKHVTDKTLENHKQALTELILRDRNHASVVAWSIANEAGIWLEEEATSQKAESYWQQIYDHTKALDASRPITMPTFSKLGSRDFGNKYCDFISINRYWGWYEAPADLQRAAEMLRDELVALFERYEKPILVSEFGADTVEGLHATYPQLFTEEYQTEFLQTYFDVIESLPFTIGEHIWNFADFRTPQHFRRVVLNRKGVFNRQREPKSAAFAVRQHWQPTTPENDK